MSPVYIKTRTVKSGKRYLVYWRRGGRAFKEMYAGSFKTLKEAKTRRDLIAGELAAGRDPGLALERLKTPRPLAPGLAVRWDECVASRVDVGDKAHAKYGNARAWWIPLLGEARDPSTITPADVQAGIAAMSETLKPATVTQYVSPLGMVLDYCDVAPNPVRSPKVKLPAGSKAEKLVPSNVAWFAIRDGAKKRSQVGLRLIECCGLRVSEAALLEWGDVDFVEGMVRIRREGTKTAAGRRWVPVPPELLDLVDLLVPNEDRRSARTVLGVKSGALYSDLVAACVSAGVPVYGTHALRHRRISLWLRHGIDSVQVSRWAGHSKPSESTDTYGHVILDPAGDEWRDFWLDAYAATGAAQVRHEGVPE